jgi:hypothetical protein
MEFFDKKEEVIDLQLTQYGKYLLSLGKLRPIFYAFYDDNVVYDSEYTGFTETQNATEGRIQENTPKLKTFSNFHSIEDDISRAVETKNSGDPDLAQLMIQQTPDKSQILINPLANSDMASDKIPAWDISVLSGEILTGSTTSTLTLSGSETVLNIPQLDVEVKYDVRVESGAEIDDGMFDLPGGEDIPFIFADGTFFSVEKNDLIFQIIEENVPHGNDNFEIEIFSMEDLDGNGKIKDTSLVTEIKQLNLIVKPDLVVNDILIDEADGKSLPVSKIDSSFADYYFDIDVDGEISSAIICRHIKDGDQDLYKFARKDFTCPDTEQGYEFLNPYTQKESIQQCEDES